MSSIGDLVATLGVNTAQWSAGLKKSQADLAAFQASVGGTMAKIGASVAAVFGAQASLRAADQDIRAMQKLEAVLAATGGAAGLTAQEIGKYSSELQRSTNFGDEVSNQAAAVLATFRNLSGDTFKKTLSLAQDFAELKEIGLTEAATLLGKALNSPLEGMAKLSKAGVQFTASEKATIKAMTEIGDVAGAQRVMLNALGESFGGVAKAAASPLTQIQNYIGDIGEEIGKVLLVPLKWMIDNVIPFLANWGSSLGRVVVAIGTTVAVMRTVVAVQKSIAVGAALIQALAGPAGWANLAIGAAVFATSLAAIEVAMSGVASAAQDAGGKTRAMGAEIEDIGAGEGGGKNLMSQRQAAATSLQEMLDRARNPAFDLHKQLMAVNEEFRKLGGQGDENLKNIIKADIIDRAVGFTSKLESVNDEIRILQGTATEASIALEKMAKAGVDPTKIKELEEAIKKRDKIAANKKTWREIEERGKAVTESLMTPEEKMQKEIQDLKNLRALGAIDEKTLDRGIAKAKAGGANIAAAESGKFGALQKGSSEQVSAVLTAMRGKDELPKKQLDVAEQQLAVAERQETQLENMVTNAIVLFAGSIS